MKNIANFGMAVPLCVLISIYVLSERTQLSEQKEFICLPHVSAILVFIR